MRNEEEERGDVGKDGEGNGKESVGRNDTETMKQFCIIHICIYIYTYTINQEFFKFEKFYRPISDEN